MSDWNRRVIEEFRANRGRVASHFASDHILLLHTIGRKSGQVRINPLMYRKVPNGYAIFGSMGGAPGHPDWYRNLVANPDVTIEVGTETIPVRARVVTGTERNEIWEPHKATWPTFADYERRTEREIPVIVLEPIETAD